jgi:hypothetical protein
MGTNRDPAKLAEMWTSWHDNVGTPMRADYAKLVEIANQGAKDLGYADVGAMWRSGYDMPADDFAKLTDKLWTQVKPLYDQLHCYTRTKLNEKYGDAVQPKTGPIRADLLGNMWAQEWGDIYPIVAPKGAGDIGYDIGDLLKTQGYDPIKMVKTGEVSAPIVIGRDHLDSGSVASPYRETEAMLDGSDAIADWPLLNALLNTASGATWVSLHHGGGVGIGRSIHSGQVLVVDGTDLAAEKVSRVLVNDPGSGVMRHVDAGYERAADVARERGLRVPMWEI